MLFTVNLISLNVVMACCGKETMYQCKHAISQENRCSKRNIMLLFLTFDFDLIMKPEGCNIPP